MAADMQRLYDALRQADAAGDTEGAQKLASYIRSQQASAAAPGNGDSDQPSVLDQAGQLGKEMLQSGGRMITNAIAGIPGIFADGTAQAYNYLHGRSAPTLQQAAAGQPGDYPFPVLPSQDLKNRLSPVLGTRPAGVAGVAEDVGSAVAGAKLPLPGVQDAGQPAQGLAAAKAADASQGTLGMQSGSGVVQALESTLARLPGGGSLVRAFRSQNQQAANTTDQIVDNLSNGADVSPTGAGKVLETQLAAAGQRAKAIAKQGYDDLERMLPAQATVPVTNTTSLLRSLTRSPPGASNTMSTVVSPKLQQLSAALEKDVQDAQGGGLPYGAVKAVRSQIGQQIDWGPFGTNPDNGSLKLVYGALTRDMSEGAATFGPEAAKAVAKTNAEYAASKQTGEVLESVINKAGGPEKVFTSLMNGTRDGATTLNAVLDNIPQSARNTLAASALQRMGRSTAGAQNVAGDAFSADTFLTNWNRMSPEARNALFGQLPGGYADSISQLASNVAKLKAYARVIPNSSNTAQAAMWGGEVTGMLTTALTGHLGAAAGIAGSVAATKILSTALTNPQTAAYMAKQTAAMAVQATAAARQSQQ